ncbi:MAG: PHB depolymerase family esterase [Polaromonas sp.]
MGALLSAGGGMASILASCYPDVFAAAAIHSGPEYEAVTNFLQAEEVLKDASKSTPPDTAGYHAFQCSGAARRLMPVIVFHGSADERVNPNHAEQVIQQFAQANDYADDGADNDSILANATSSADKDSPPRHRYTVYDYRYAGKLLMRRVLIKRMKHAWS